MSYRLSDGRLMEPDVCTPDRPNPRAHVLKHREPFPDPDNPGWLRCPGCKVMFLPTYKGAG